MKDFEAPHGTQQKKKKGRFEENIWIFPNGLYRVSRLY